MDGFVIWYADFRTNMPKGWKADKAGTDFHQGVIEWLASLGLDPHRLLPAVGVCRWEGQYELHVDEVVSTADGHDRVDPLNETKLLAIRRIIPLPSPSWPSRPDEKAAV